MKTNGCVMWACLACLVLGIPTIGLGDQKPRTFTASNGKTMKATIVTAIGDAVKIKRADGRIFSVKRTAFVEDDQEYIAEWAKDQARLGNMRAIQPSLNITVDTGRSNRLSKVENYDDRREQLTMSVKVENRESKASLEDLKLTVFAFARGITRKKSMKVLVKQDLPLSVVAGGTTKVTAQKVSNTYDNSRTAKYGYKYSGWAVIIRDAEGNVIYKKGSTPTYEKGDARDLLNLTQGRVIGDDLDEL